MILKLLLLTELAFAAGGAPGDPHAIPWSSIAVQALNLFLLVVLLFFALRKTISALFANRAKDYQTLVSKAEAARQEAERGKREISARLARLDSQAAQGVSQVRTEAEELRARMIQDAKTLAARLEAEAERTAKIETEKAKAELRRELLHHALNETREDFKKLGTTEQKKLQAEFADKIQVVGG